MAARGVWHSQGAGLSPVPAPRFDGWISPVATPPERGARGAEIRPELEL